MKTLIQKSLTTYFFNYKSYVVTLLCMPFASLAQSESQPPGEGTDLGIQQKAKNFWNEKVPEAIRDGKLLLNLRPRYEYAEIDGLDKSNALTLRTALGYQTAEMFGLQALVEMEDVSALGKSDNYNQAGLNPGGAGRAVIADPEGTEINQAWIQYNKWDTQIRFGRQELTLDNARFIGNVPWRQNYQSFDSVLVKNTSIADLTMTYAYLLNINRVLGSDHPQGDWSSNSHILHASYSRIDWINLSAYGYLLDLDENAVSRANSSQTYGMRGSGAVKISGDWSLPYELEGAYQQDYGDNPKNYETWYTHTSLGVQYQKWQAGIGQEILFSDKGKGFGTPLATLHIFNGWADSFLAETPADGLSDAYVWIGGTLPGKVGAKFIYHDFESQRAGRDLGQEFDIVFTRKFGDHWSSLIKAAHHDHSSGLADVTRFWGQVEFKF